LGEGEAARHTLLDEFAKHSYDDIVGRFTKAGVPFNKLKYPNDW
jgi:hypothetical protein